MCACVKPVIFPEGRGDTSIVIGVGEAAAWRIIYSAPICMATSPEGGTDVIDMDQRENALNALQQVLQAKRADGNMH